MMAGLRTSIQFAGARQGILLGVVAALLGGCTTVSPDAGMGLVSTRVAAELDHRPMKIDSTATANLAAGKVAVLLRQRLTADTAVQVALLNNRGLQAEYNTLGISEARFIEASLPPAPTVSIAAIAAPGQLEVERRLIASILSLFTLEKRRRIAATQIAAAQYRAIEATFRLAATVRKAYYRAVAARQTADFLEKARMTADAAADLTQELGETGAATKLAQARASAFNSEISIELARTRLEARVTREQLTRLMGLWGGSGQFTLPATLSNLPPKLLPSDRLEAEAIRKRAEIIAARLDLDGLAMSLGLTEQTRVVSVLELAGLSNYERVREEGETERSHPLGIELEIQIPIWDFGKTRVRHARETYMQAVNRLVALAVDARSQVREAYVTYRGTYDISRQYRNQIIPLRDMVNEQMLLEYNGMLVDVFDLLTTSRESITSNVAAITAKRDFFLASVDLDSAMIGGFGESSGGDTSATAVVESGEGGH